MAARPAPQILTGVLPLLLAVPGLAAEVTRLAPAAVYERVAPAVVGITAKGAAGGDGGYFGTGTIIDGRGLIITSTTVVPAAASEIQVFISGGERLAARLVAVEESRELALIRIEQGSRPRRFQFVELGDSDSLQVGEPALTLGNAFLSIQHDDQVALGEGVISGMYTVLGTLSESKYSGRVLETSAHLNSGMDGGPLVDARGALVGVLCLNYSRSRWLGTAAPIDDLKPFVLPHLGIFSDDEERLPRFAGLRLADDDGRVVVRAVREGSPAQEAGLAPGDVVLQLDGAGVPAVAAFRQAFQAAAGSTLRLRVARQGAERDAELRSWRRL